MKSATIRDCLQQGRTRLALLASARQDTELLLLRVLGRDRAWLMTHPEAELSAEQAAQFESWLARRARQEPVQYILGEQEFFGLRLRVTPDVLIPRPETEHLVEAALERLPRDRGVRVVDVGTGSGAIAVALASSLALAEITAVDLSSAALAVAQENAERHGVSRRTRFLQSDLLSALGGEHFDMIVSNPPYIADAEVLEPQVAEYEPREALFSGPTGLEVYQRLIPASRAMLAPGGWLLLEIGHGQREAFAELLAGWDAVQFLGDLQGIPRVGVARRT